MALLKFRLELLNLEHFEVWNAKGYYFLLLYLTAIFRTLSHSPTIWYIVLTLWNSRLQMSPLQAEACCESRFCRYDTLSCRLLISRMYLDFMVSICCCTGSLNLVRPSASNCLLRPQRGTCVSRDCNRPKAVYYI